MGKKKLLTTSTAQETEDVSRVFFFVLWIVVSRGMGNYVYL